MDDMAAYLAGRELGKANFRAAMSGLIQGHQDQLDEMAERLAKKDMAFLMALTLTEKGKRLDANGVMAQKIAEGIDSLSACATERKFLERTKTEK
jgi:hypothetical protein